MAGAHTGAARYLRTTVISGSVYQESTTASSAAVATTINSYATAGLFATIQFVPTTTQTVTATVPTAPSTAANNGWRDATAEDAANQITWDATTWTVRLRMSASASQSVLTTVILYRQNGSGTTEIGRGTNTSTLTTTVATLSISVSATAGLVFAAGDLIQCEVYTTTLTLGVATPPSTATTVTCTVGESEVNNGSKVSPGTYSTQVVRSATTAATLTGVGARAIAASRSFATALSLATAPQRNVKPSAKVAALSLAVAVQKTVAPAAKVAALSLAVAVQKTIAPAAKVAALTLAGVGARRIAAARSGVAALSLATVFARSVNSARGFATSITLTASGLVQMPLVVLSRIASGGTTVIKKMVAVFDD